LVWHQSGAAERGSESHIGAQDEELIMGRFTFGLDAVVQQLGQTKGRQTQLGSLPFG